jgi:hypothetical protein
VTHPLVAALSDGARLGPDPGPPFVDPAAADGEALVRAALVGSGRCAARAAAASVVEDLVLGLAPVLHALLVHRRAPALPPGSVRLGGWESVPDGPRLVVTGPRFLCLEDDPEAGHADAEPVATLDALLATAGARAASEVVAPLVETLHAASRFSRRALWGLAAWSLGAAGAELGDTLGDVPRAEAETGALLRAHPALAPHVPRFVHVEAGGAAMTWTVPTVCCLGHHRTDDGRRCSFCPLNPPDVQLADARRRTAPQTA